MMPVNLMEYGLWRLLAGPALAALHFVVSYGATGIFCERSDNADALLTLRYGLGAFTLVILALIALVTLLAWQQGGFLQKAQDRHTEDSAEGRHAFLAHITVLISALSFVGVAMISLPILLVGSCS